MNREAATPMNEQHHDGLPLPRRYWSAAAIWLALAMAVLDGSIANVALPTIAHDLGASPATSVWIVNAYQLTITILLLPLAAYGDRCGYRGIYLPGLVLFTVGSLGCAIAHSLTALIAARVFQGVGAACIMSMNAALVRATYPAKMLGRGIGYNALVLSMAAAAGPTLAALILSVGSWPWLFLINLPIGIAAVIIGWKALPHVRGHGNPFDWVAALLSGAMMGFVVFGAETFARESGAIGGALIVAGIAAGALLSSVALRRTRFEVTPARLFYTHDARVGVGLSLLVVSRVVYRLVQIALHPAILNEPPEAFLHRPVTLVILGTLVGYYTGYAAGLLRRHRALRAG